jgi:hypothetical protein
VNGSFSSMLDGEVGLGKKARGNGGGGGGTWKVGGMGGEESSWHPNAYKYTEMSKAKPTPIRKMPGSASLNLLSIPATFCPARWDNELKKWPAQAQRTRR